MAYIPHGGLSYVRDRSGRSQGPYAAPGLMVGRVIAVHRDLLRVDVVLGTGEPLRRVPVATPLAGTRAGMTYLQSISNAVTDLTPQGPIGSYGDDGNRSVYAVVGYAFDDPSSPMVLGFLHPHTNQMAFNRAGFRIDRHESDLYTMIENGPAATYDPATDTTIPNWEFCHPSGLWVRIGQGTTHEDLTGQDQQGRAAFRGTANANAPAGTAGPYSADFVPLTAKHPTGSQVEMDTSGNIILTPGPTGSIQIGPHVSSSGSTPSVTLSANCGTGASFTITGNDRRGRISVTAGTAPSAGLWITVTYTRSYGTYSYPRVTPGYNPNGDPGVTVINPGTITAAIAGDKFSITCQNQAVLQAGTQYDFYYQVEG